MTMTFSEFLLRTAFACMACDGEIAPQEVDLIKSMAAAESLFGSIDINKELDTLVADINQRGKSFLKSYLSLLSEMELSEKEELDVLRVALKTIWADNKIEYSEIKFFKILRSNLKVDDQTILDKVAGVDETYLAQDIRADYMQLYESYFNSIQIPKFVITDLHA